MAVDKTTGRQNDMLPFHVKKFLNLKKNQNFIDRNIFIRCYFHFNVGYCCREFEYDGW